MNYKEVVQMFTFSPTVSYRTMCPIKFLLYVTMEIMLLASLAILSSSSVHASEAASAMWTELHIKAIGPKTAPEINIDATVSDDHIFKMSVVSAFGTHIIEEELPSPWLFTLQVKHYFDHGMLKDYFVICMHYGTGKYLGESEPRWDINMKEYSFTPEGITTKYFPKDGKTRVTDCNF